MVTPNSRAERTEPATGEDVARMFHETYERLAPDYGYRTREASAKPWDKVPEQNRALMVATVTEVLAALDLPGRVEALREENERLKARCGRNEPTPGATP